MATTSMTNIRHYLDKNGKLPENLPRPAYNFASYFGKIIEAVTSRRSDTDNYSTNVSAKDGM